MKNTIFLNNSRKGTNISFFNNFIDEKTEGSSFAYLVLDNLNKPFKITSSESDARIIRNNDNTFSKYPNFDEILIDLKTDKIFKEGIDFKSFNQVLISGTTELYSGKTISELMDIGILNSKSIIKGRTISQQLSFLLSDIKKTQILNDFIQKNKDDFGQKSISAVFFNDGLIDDYFVNISVKREIDILDTLNVHNRSVGSFPTIESPTGVLFGKLESTQKIFDENGNKVKIPLKNTVVAIFNTSDEFPSVSSTDIDGNRIVLNLKENSSSDLYFNGESFSADTAFLKDSSSFNNVPDKYKYTTITNDNGEFILYDIPIGEQIFLFEIDLLKQGLTHDEVALNFFKYPTEENPNVDNIPHFFYKQINVNIVPSWGNFQTGYTELNITVPLDLRKWATYYTSPVSSDQRTIEEKLATAKSFRLLSLNVRDMTKKDFAFKSLEIVEIDDLLNKNREQTLEWNQESKLLKIKAEFKNTDYKAFKLPANLYDPEGFGSNNKKGVWICAYQIKMIYTSDLIYRTTGFDRNFIGSDIVVRSHFDLNKNVENAKSSPKEEVGLGKFPYEKPWTINYPEKYSIPKPPSIPNTGKTFKDITSFAIQSEPTWIDGDLVGINAFNPPKSFGYGLQNIRGVATENIFSQRITSGAIYKYEKNVRWDDQYSNGFLPELNDKSQVVDGERFQRVESGYGYWLKPEGWPRIQNFSWGDIILQSDLDGINPPTDLTPLSYKDYVFQFQSPEENFITLRMDSVQPSKQGALDIYRLIEPNKILIQEPRIIEHFVNLDFKNILQQNRITTFLRSRVKIGDKDFELKSITENATLNITNNGLIDIKVLNVIISSGKTKKFFNILTQNFKIILPTNIDFDIDTNAFINASYTITIDGVTIIESNTFGPNVEHSFSQTMQLEHFVGATSDKIPTYSLISFLIKAEDVKGNNKDKIAMNGIAFIGTESTLGTSQFVPGSGIGFIQDNSGGIEYEDL